MQNEPIVFIPNALDLNGVVNYWKPVIKMIDFSDYKVSIYSRQGELVALLDNIDQVWDGRIMNSSNLASMGVYVYQVEFKNPSGKYFHKKEIEDKYESLVTDYKSLMKRLDKINNQKKDEEKKEAEFSQKIDELNQETDTLLEEIDKWQM